MRLSQLIILSSCTINWIQANMFLDDLINAPKGTCGTLGASQLNSEILTSFPKLESCFSFSSLFFSNSRDVCKEGCMNMTVGASALISKRCQLPKPSENSKVSDLHYLSYSTWSDYESVKLICSKRPDKPLLCLNELVNAKVAIENSKSKSSPGAWKVTIADKQKVCTECIKLAYNIFAKRPYEVPTVYYSQLPEPGAFFYNVGLLCF